MQNLEYLVAIQTSPRPETGVQITDDLAWYLVFAIVGLVLFLSLVVFIRTNSRRASKRHG